MDKSKYSNAQIAKQAAQKNSDYVGFAMMVFMGTALALFFMNVAFAQEGANPVYLGGTTGSAAMERDAVPTYAQTGGYNEVNVNVATDDFDYQTYYEEDPFYEYEASLYDDDGFRNEEIDFNEGVISNEASAVMGTNGLEDRVRLSTETGTTSSIR